MEESFKLFSDIIEDIVAEKLTESWQKGVEIYKDTYTTPIKEKTDVAFILLSSLNKDLTKKYS